MSDTAANQLRELNDRAWYLDEKYGPFFNDAHALMHICQALPALIAVIEAAEHHLRLPDWTRSDSERTLKDALAALRDQLNTTT